MTTIRLALHVGRCSTREQLGLEAEAIRRRMNVPLLVQELVAGDPRVKAAVAELTELATVILARAGDSYEITTPRGPHASRGELLLQRALQSFGQTTEIATRTGSTPDRLRELRGDTPTKENTP